MSVSPQDFDFDKWLDDAERPERSVTVYQKSGLIADLDALAERIANADETEDVDGPSMAGGVGQLRAEYAEIARQFHDSALTIRVQGLNEDEQVDLRKVHPDLEASDLGRVVMAEAITSPKITPEQVRKLEKAIGDAQFARIVSAYYQACKEIPVVSADFLPKPSTRGDGGES
jgi:hypothetical protein